MQKKILVLTPRYPYPLTSGDKVRIFNVSKYLADQGYALTLLSFVDEKTPIVHSEAMRSIFTRIETIYLPRWKSYFNVARGLLSPLPLQVNYYSSQKMREAIEKELQNGYDGILAHFIRMAQYMLLEHNINTVLEMTDALSLLYSRGKTNSKNGLWNAIYRIEEKKLKKYETQCVKNFDATVVVSNVDKKYLTDLLRDNFSSRNCHISSETRSNDEAVSGSQIQQGGATKPQLKYDDCSRKDYLARGLHNAGTAFESKIKVLPNGVSEYFTNFQYAEYDPNCIIFIGNLRSYQNQDTVSYFINEIYSLVREKNPDAKFRIIGSNQTNFLTRMNGVDGIELTGAVDDVREHAKDACVSISSVRIGAGIQNKILESMAMGIPVVTTHVGKEGVSEATDGIHFLTADTSREFANHVLNLMTNRALRQKISAAGKQLIEQHYRWPQQLQQYDNLFI